MRRQALAVAALALLACGRQGPSVRVYVPLVPETLDPYRDHRFGPLTIYSSIFEMLAAGDGEETPVPGLARAWSVPQPDTCILNLRPGVRFHDGTPLDAQAVVGSFEQARAHDLFVARQLASVTSIEAVDPLTVRLHASGPLSNVTYLLIGVPIARPGPAGLVGTGPYRVIDLAPGQSVRVERFEAYWGSRPYVAAADFRPFRTAAAADVLRSDPGGLMVDPPRAAVDLARGSGTHAVASQASNTVVYLAFGLAPGLDTPFRDRRLRQAVQLALDRPKLLHVGSLLGSGRPASQLVPPGVFGFDPGLTETTQNLVRARALVAEAGFAAGLDEQLECSTTYEAAARELAAQLAPLGIRLTIRAEAPSEFSRRVERREARNYVYSWVLGLQSGEALSSFLRTRDEARGLGLRNRTGYSNPELDAAIDAALEAREPDDRLPYLQKAMRLLMSDLPWVPLFVPDSARIYPANLRFAPSVDPFLRLQRAEPAR